MLHKHGHANMDMRHQYMENFKKYMTHVFIMGVQYMSDMTRHHDKSTLHDNQGKKFNSFFFLKTLSESWSECDSISYYDHSLKTGDLFILSTVFVLFSTVLYTDLSCEVLVTML